jgi:hypothetical protein
MSSHTVAHTVVTFSYYSSILLVQTGLPHEYMKTKYYINGSIVHDNDSDYP